MKSRRVINVFFPSNSMVEYLAVNEAVLGSNPSLGALERWLSGLKQKFTKLPMVYSIRGFKSYSFRLDKI
jgi:hypothetical protein